MAMTPEESFALATGAATAPEGEESTATGAEGEETSAPTNPSWRDEAWKDVPEPIKEQQKSVFEKWDRNYGQLNERFKPYEAFEKSGVNADQLQQALELQQLMITNPETVFDFLAQEHGFTTQQQAQAAHTAGVESSDLDPNDPVTKRLAAIEAKEAAYDRERQAQQQTFSQQQQVQQNIQRINDEFTTLETRVGKLSDFDKNRIAEKAIINAAANGNGSIGVAYYQYLDERDQLLAAHGAPKAPKVMGGGSTVASAPVTEKKVETDDQRLERAMAMAKQISESQG